MNTATGLEPPPATPIDPSVKTQPPAKRNLLPWLAVLIGLCGVLARTLPEPGFKNVGFDATLYRTYILTLEARGLGGYAPMTEAYIANQRRDETVAKLPPTRFLYVFAGWVWKRAEFGAAPPHTIDTPAGIARDPVLVSLHRVSFVSSVLAMLLAGLAAWWMLGAASGLGVLALMAFAPLQIHLGQHALIDSFFTLWAVLAVWSLWENLRHPNHSGWLALHGVTLASMVMAKESSFFVVVALAGLVLANRWLRFGTVTPRLLLVLALSPAAGVAALMALSGGPGNFFAIFQVLVPKVHRLAYAIETCNGPWHRYLIDLLTMSPAMLLLAIGGIFCVVREQRAYGFLLGFVVLSYAMMCNVRDGMNLRYASIWDLPLRALAFGQIAWLASHLAPARRTLAITVATAALCAYELRQYFVFFVDGALYELATGGLLEAVKILK